MKCEEVRELLIDFMEGELPDRQAEIREHLDSCVGCMREYQRLEQDLARLKARREELTPDDEEWVSFLPGIRRKISLREARRKSLVPVRRLIPILGLMVLIALLYRMKLPVSTDETVVDEPMYSGVLSVWISEGDVADLAELELGKDDLYDNLVGEDGADALQRLDEWYDNGGTVIDQIMDLSREDQETVFDQLESSQI